ncbi:MAG: ATP-binding protein [Campylobacterota bacterium]|nr:ATP-binding protein [Campylobacterota bacterium]
MRNKLKSVTLVNSGDYRFSTIDIEGNVLLSGANGAGKSTFLRAVLFFYNPSLKRTDFGIDANKTSFLDYYFPYPQSYLLYEYINQYGRNYVLVFKTKKLRFRFFAVDNFQEVDLKHIFHVEGETLEPDNVIMNFRKVALHESDTFVGVEQFSKIIYGQEARSKKSDLDQYALYQANGEYRHIGNTIKNIFLNHKIDADSIKALLVSNINEMDRPSVQLEIVKESIDKFLDKQESIEQFSKHIKIARSIAKSRNDYLDLVSEEEKYLLHMISREAYVVDEKEIVVRHMDEIEGRYREKEQEKKSLEEAFSNQSQQKRIEKGILEKEIQEAKGYVKAYIEKNIEEKLLQFDQLEHLRGRVESVKKEKEILVGKAENRVKAFDNEIVLQETQKREIENEVSAQINAHHATFLQEQEALSKHREKEIDERTTRYEEDEKEVIAKHNPLKHTLQDTKDRLTELKYKTLYEAEIVDLKEQIRLLNEEKAQLVSSSRVLGGEIEALGGQIEAMQTQTAHKIEAINLKQKIQLDKIEEKITTLNRKINAHPDSLIAFVVRHDLPHANHILSIVKDDMLTATDLNPKIINQSNTLYGLEVDVKLSGRLEVFKAELEGLKEKRESLLLEKESLISLLEQESEKRVSQREKARGETFKQKSEIEKQIPLLESKIFTQGEHLKHLEEEALREKEKQKAILVEEIQGLEVNIEKYQEELDEIFAKKKGVKEEITHQYMLLVKKIEAEKVFKNDASLKKKEHRILLCEESIEAIRRRKNDALNSEGISQEALQTLESQIQQLKETIEVYRGYEQDINEYKFNQKPKIEKLDESKEQLEVLERAIFEGKEAHDKVIEMMQKELHGIDTERKKYHAKDAGYQAELNYFRQQREADQNFSKKIDALKSEALMPIDDSYRTTAIDTYYVHYNALMREIYKSKDDLIKYVGELFKKIDAPELLNLIPNRDNSVEEFLRVSADIDRFLNEEKIETLIRETISLFKLAIRQLSRDIEDIQKHTGNINRQLSKIRKGINDLSGISVIDEIDIRLQESENRILLDLEKLKKIHDTYGLDYDENSGEGLFSILNQSNSKNERNDKEKKSDREMMKVFKSLSQNIENSKKDALSLEECFEIEFKVSENNNESRWQNTLNGIGSEGTDVIVKILIYVSLLSLTKKENIKDEADIHCLVDEIGKLSPLYFKEVIDFTNALGIYFVNGMPSEMLVSSFKNHYKLRKVGAQKEKTTVATKIIYRVDEEEESHAP